MTEGEQFTNGLVNVYLFAKHPMRDFVLIGSGVELDCRWVPFSVFLEKFKPIAKASRGD